MQQDASHETAPCTPCVLSLIPTEDIVAFLLGWVFVIGVIEHILYACQYLHDQLLVKA